MPVPWATGGNDERQHQHVGWHGDTGGPRPLFVVRRPRYQSLMFEIIGGIVVVIGLLGGLGGLMSEPDDGALSLGSFLLIFVGGGGLFFVFGLMLSAGRIKAYDRHLDVKSGFGRYRRRELDDLHTLRFGAQSQGGGPTFISLTAWNDRRKKQFVTTA